MLTGLGPSLPNIIPGYKTAILHIYTIEPHIQVGACARWNVNNKRMEYP